MLFVRNVLNYKMLKELMVNYVISYNWWFRLPKMERFHFTLDERRNLGLTNARKGHVNNIIVTTHKYHTQPRKGTE